VSTTSQLISKNREPPMCKSIVLATLVLTFASGCGSPTGSSGSGYRYADEAISSADFDEDVARDRAMDDLVYESYGSIGEPYGCTDDCSGHEAGFEWAKENGVTDGSCYGDSVSFQEGCHAYGEAIEEKIDEYRAEDESSW
jgi:hypothetical protein